jgi:hypothetical protein
MGKKVVIAQGFRLAFPDELGGLPYSKEEYEVYDISGEVEKHGKPAVEMPKAIEQEPVIVQSVEPVSNPAMERLTIIAGYVAKLNDKQREAFINKLGTDYSVESVNDLTVEQADDIIAKFKGVKTNGK